MSATGPLLQGLRNGTFGQSGLKRNLPSGHGKSVQVMRLPERRLAIEPTVLLDLGKRAPFGNPEHLIDQLARAHVESAMFCAEALGEGADYVVVVAAFARRLNQFGTQDEVLVTATAIDIVVLKKCCRRKHHIRHLRGLRHELLVDTDEEIIASKTLLHLGLVRRNGNRIGVLDNERVNRTTALQYVASRRSRSRRCAIDRACAPICRERRDLQSTSCRAGKYRR